MERAWWLQCDYCEEGQAPTDLHLRHAYSVRELAKEWGWHKLKGKDCCPECWEALKVIPGWPGRPVPPPEPRKEPQS